VIPNWFRIRKLQTHTNLDDEDIRAIGALPMIVQDFEPGAIIVRGAKDIIEIQKSTIVIRDYRRLAALAGFSDIYLHQSLQLEKRS